MAIATIVVVAIAVMGSVTVLPATLALLGDRINKGRIPFLDRRRPRAGGGVWARLARMVTRRPLAALVTAVCVLGALAVPALDLHPASSGNGRPAGDTPVLVAQRAIERSFPGAPSEAQLVVPAAPRHARGTQRPGPWRARPRGDDGRGPVELERSRDGRTAVVALPMPDHGVEAAEKTVADLRAPHR